MAWEGDKPQVMDLHSLEMKHVQNVFTVHTPYLKHCLYLTSLQNKQHISDSQTLIMPMPHPKDTKNKINYPK